MTTPKKSTDGTHAQARTFHDVTITARCIDCERMFTGFLAVRFIRPAEGPGLEILVADQKRNEAHAIARVELHLIPIVTIDDAPLPPAGSA
jgi:hypothetical protein